MNAIGEQLKAARLARGYTVDMVADETNIAKRYIVALEEENFSIFPGDPYILGFIRNYSEFLGIESQSLINTFRGIRIQEQPVPLQELLHEKKPKRTIIIGAAIGTSVVVLTLVGLLVAAAMSKQKIESATSAERKPTQYKMENSELEKRFYIGDTLLVNYNNDTHAVKVSAVDDMVTIETPIGKTRFMMGEEGSIDLDKDNIAELYVFISDFQKNKPDTGVMVKFKTAGNLSLATTESAVPVMPVEAAASQAIKPAEASTVPERPITAQTVIFSGKRSPYPFVLSLTFRNYAMFRHEIDRKDREERYYHKGDQLTTTANNSAKIWTSNAGACKLTIQASGGQSVDVELGAPGEVAVKSIKWAQGDDSLWNLSVYNVN